MTRDEVIAILSILKSAYPNFYKSMTKSELNNIVNLWHQMFLDDNCKIVTEAVKALIVSFKFPPTIADIKDKVDLITKPESMTEMEAWGLVRKAISDSFYNAGSRFAELPELIQRVVGSPTQLTQWGLMEPETVESVIQSNFMRSYKAKMIHAKEVDRLPESTKKMIGELVEKFKMIEG